MAVDSSIPLQAQVAPLGNALLQGYARASDIRRDREEAPMRNQLMQTQLAGAKQQQQAGAQRQFNDEQKSLMMGAAQIKPLIDAGDAQGALSALRQRQQALKTVGLNTTQTDEAIQMLESGNTAGLKQSVDALYSAGMRSGVLQEPYTRGQSLTGDVQLAREMGIDLSTEDGRKQFQQFRLGQRPAPKADSSYYVPVQTGEGMRLLNSRTGELTTPTGDTGKPLLAPAIDPDAQSKVVTSKKEAEAAVKRDTQMRKNGVANAVYQTGISNLLKSLGDTTTGPIAGRIPALTANAQIAEGARSTMAPVLKQMFREAGEGTFTEGDQKLLMDMLPGRNDHPEAAKAKIKMINDIVAAKLGVSESQQAPAQGGNDDQAALDWARANPNDPRAAQIMQLHGGR